MNEQGSSSAMLLISWLALIGFVGYSFDLALAHVYREQLRTALESAVTAGAMQAKYHLTVRLERRQWRAVEDCDWRMTGPGDPENGVPPTYEWECSGPYWEVRTLSPDTAAGWEEVVWWPHRLEGKALHLVFPEKCQERRGRPSRVGQTVIECHRAEVVPDSCGLREIEPQAAATAARRAYEANRPRWQGRMTDRPADPAIVAEGGTFEVGMTATGEMETRFLRIFGIDAFPIVPVPLDGDSFKARLVRFSAVPDHCPR